VVSVLQKEVGNDRVFRASTQGLYYVYVDMDMDDSTSDGVLLVATVKENKSHYTNAEVIRAKQARDLQCKIGRPSTREFLRLVTNNLIPNSPVTKRDIIAADDIFGTHVGFLKERTVRRNPPRINTATLCFVWMKVWIIRSMLPTCSSWEVILMSTPEIAPCKQAILIESTVST
jgi:hypothetical protein